MEPFSSYSASLVKRDIFPATRVFDVLVEVTTSQLPLAIIWHCLHDDTFSCFHRTPTCDGQTGELRAISCWHSVVRKNAKQWHELQVGQQ